jgi:hypothetical protein
MPLSVTEDMMQILVVALSSAVLLVSMVTQLRKRNSRYIFPVLAFDGSQNLASLQQE